MRPAVAFYVYDLPAMERQAPQAFPSYAAAEEWAGAEPYLRVFGYSIICGLA